MTQSALVQLRLRNQKLFSSEFQRPVEVVRWMGAVQAQDFNGAKWALALRMRALSGDAGEQATNDVIENDVIEKAFNQGEILRTHLLRPTWHFVTPEDIRWLLELTAPRINIRCGSAYRTYELDGPTLKRSNKILTKALQRGQHLTRTELKAILNRSGVAADDGIRLAHILLRAELDGVVCSGPRRGKQFTYALLEERVPAMKSLRRDEALAKLTRTYFASHGPATLPDFIWWSGLTTGDARRGIELSDSILEQVRIDGKYYLAATDDHAANPRNGHTDNAHPANAHPANAHTANAHSANDHTTNLDPTCDAYTRVQTSRPNPLISRHSQPSANLLPAYDEYNVAYKDRDTAFAVALLSPTLMIDGRIVGNWKSTSDKNGVTISLTIAKTLKKPEKAAVVKAAHRYARFLNVPVTHVGIE
jgi:hypothetical protein